MLPLSRLGLAVLHSAYHQPYTNSAAKGQADPIGAANYMAEPGSAENSRLAKPSLLIGSTTGVSLLFGSTAWPSTAKLSLLILSTAGSGLLNCSTARLRRLGLVVLLKSRWPQLGSQSAGCA